MRCIQKQRGSYSQVEAMLFGQAGMLDEALDCPYYRLLQREYRFLRHKFGLTPLDPSLFKNLRIRPVNFPCLKLAQLTAVWTQHDTLFSEILTAGSIGQIKQYLRVSPSEYWATHYKFPFCFPPERKAGGRKFLMYPADKYGGSDTFCLWCPE